MNGTVAPLVSVIIATYNRAHTLGEAIESALGQRYPNLEVIVVDDGSGDATQEKLRAYGDRIVTLRQTNRGYAAARNAGFRVAKGKYVAWLDSDDLFLPDKTALQVAFMEAHEDVVLTSSEFVGFDGRGLRADSVRTYYGMFRDAHGPASVFDTCEVLDPSSVEWLRGTTHPDVRIWSGRVVHKLLHGSFVHPPTVMMRRDAAQKAGLLDETLRNSVEYEFLFRLARLGAFAFIDHPLIRYRFSADQFSGALHEGSMSLSIKRILCELPQTQPDVVARARGVYRRRLAACHLNVARVFAETDRWLAFRSAFQALRLGHVDRSIVSISARILLPGSVVRGVRRLKRFAFGLPATLRKAIFVDQAIDLMDMVPWCGDVLSRLT
jgi:glycosyltransferase involved in cell wall biosynthesis